MGATIIAPMHEPWFYAPQLQAGRIELAAGEARHALQSLRLRAGATITLFDGCGGIARAVLAEAAPARGKRPPLLVALVDRVELDPPSARSLSLIVAACKGERLDTLVEKCTELGVARLVLAEFERSVVHLTASHAEKLRRGAVAACKQCRRARLPEIATGVPLARALAGANGDLLVADLGAGTMSLGAWLAQRPECTAATVVVGPEGGLTEAEVTMAAQRGVQRVSLGRYVLRVETAAITAAATWAASDRA
jgi:16S rRNA (uracil1498-N3)-methyltransferase